MSDWEIAYPDMRFILMTGHTDGGDSSLARNNGMIRQYAQDQGVVLFDFADIETYTPLGDGPYNNDDDGTCEWCTAFCASNPSYCTDLPDYCAHSDPSSGGSLEAPLFCKLKAQAFWWMMARLAGWDGVTGDYIGSTNNGVWSTGTTWAGDVPVATDAVTITANTTVIVDANAVCNRLTIEPDATLVIPDGITLTVHETIDNQGTMRQIRTVNNDTVAFLEMADVYGVTRYHGVEIDTPNNLGTVTVTVRIPGVGEYCTDDATSSTYARRCVEITPQNDFSATVRLWSSADEMNGLADPRIYRYTNSQWDRLDDNPATGTAGRYTYVEATTPGFSHFLIAEDTASPSSVTQTPAASATTLPFIMLMGLTGVLVSIIMTCQWYKQVAVKNQSTKSKSPPLPPKA